MYVVIIKYIMKITPTKYHDFNILQQCDESQIDLLEKEKKNIKQILSLNKVLDRNLTNFIKQFDFQFYLSKREIQSQSMKLRKY